MVVALLLGLAATVWTGLEVLAREEGAAPLAAGAPARVAAAVVLPSAAAGDDGSEIEEETDERHDEGTEAEAWEEAHEAAANVTLALVILHVAGVLLASFAHRENLVAAMFTGRKRRHRSHA